MAQNREVKSKQFVDETGIIDGSGTSGLIKSNNSKFEASLGDWTEYTDAAGGIPVDGTGGVAADVLLERTTFSSEILTGTASLKMTKANLADAQGQGISLDVPVDKAFRGQPLKLAFNYATAGTFVHGNPADPNTTPGDAGVYLYDVTNSKLLTPNRPYIVGGGRYESSIQLPSDCEEVRMIVHVQSTSTALWVLTMDNVSLDLNSNEIIANMSDWVEYTPEFTGFGTVANVTAKYRIDGPDILLDVKYDAGTVTATEARMSLPLGYVSVDVIDTLQLVGYMQRGATSSTQHGISIEPDVDYVTFVLQGTGLTGLTVKRNGNDVSSSGQTMGFFARIPIQGLTSGAVHPASIGLNAKTIMRAYKNGGSGTANTTIASWTQEEDSVNGFNPTTGVYTVQSPGTYAVIGHVAYTGAAAAFMQVRKNGTVYQVSGPDASASLKNIQAVLPNLEYGDTITLALSATTNISAQNDGTSFSVIKVDSNSQPYAPRIAYLKDHKADTVAAGTFTAGAWQTRDLNTLEGDGSFVSLSANQFTLQPGTYDIDVKAPGWSCNRNKAKLRDITNSADIIIGSDSYSAAGTGADVTDSEVIGRFTITTETVFELQHRCQVSGSFGLASSFGVDEVYAQVKITKVL